MVHLRHDKVCQNCGYPVDKRFCSRCGQENKETRQSFIHLIAHFLEDLTHYEGRFWQTIRFLFTRPGYLSKKFLDGKRNRYVMPVRLYLFVSFTTFLLPHLLPDFSDIEPDEATVTSAAPVDERDTTEYRQLNFSSVNGRWKIFVPTEYKSIRELDSVQQLLSDSARMSFTGKWIYKRYIYLQKYDPEDLAYRFFASFGSNFAKGLFIFMPLFAFIMWIFHSRKKWLYFDHAIFVLHLFTLLLLLFCVHMLGGSIFSFFFPDSLKTNLYFSVGYILIFIYWLAYFFKANKRFYNESKTVSVLKSSAILFINTLLFLVLLVALGFMTIILLH